MFRTICIGVALASAGPAAATDVSHPVTSQQVTLYRGGGSSDFQGWIRLLNGSKDAGYIYIENHAPRRPFLGSNDYVVISIPVAMLAVTLDMLSSAKPVFINYTDGGNPENGSAFLHIGGDKLPGDEQIELMESSSGLDMSAIKTEP